MQRYIRECPARQHLKTLKPTATANESRAINDLRGECLVMAGAGCAMRAESFTTLTRIFGTPTPASSSLAIRATARLGGGLWTARKSLECLTSISWCKRRSRRPADSVHMQGRPISWSGSKSSRRANRVWSRPTVKTISEPHSRSSSSSAIAFPRPCRRYAKSSSCALLNFLTTINGAYHETIQPRRTRPQCN